MKEWKSRKTESKELDNYTCQVCGEKGFKKDGFTQTHHIKHISKGGTHELNNLQTLCDRCHIVAHRIVPSGQPAEYATQEIMNRRYGEEITYPEPEKEHRERLKILKERYKPS